ncbi:plant virulence effector HPE1-like domain-containing protein [Shinella pollutisoli]|uniref:Plant virulence effector HPE1-like domain-containing protein n=1 Tax=Shinella pollutisoli TaxID=2250594 RepID=A0ABV7DHP6_9HYPH|nr:plant virulence effector HPE1-like domain-containing protein [Shinella pollutisoli]
MRILPAATFAVLFMAAPALASSIEPFTAATGSGGSVSTVSCAACPALKAKPKGETYHVEAIAPGTQKIEIREENGERRIYRTEAWMGGSPVTFVSKAPAEPVEAADAADDAAPAVEEKIDANARTGALDTAAADETATAAMSVSREFDPSGFALRLN